MPSDEVNLMIKANQQPSSLIGRAFILVFSVASRKSLEELKPILELIAEVRITDLEKIDFALIDLDNITT